MTSVPWVHSCAGMENQKAKLLKDLSMIMVRCMDNGPIVMGSDLSIDEIMHYTTPSRYVPRIPNPPATGVKLHALADETG